MTIEFLPLAPVHPAYDPKAGVWYLEENGVVSLEAPTLMALSLLLPEGTAIVDYHPDGYKTTRGAQPLGRPSLRPLLTKFRSRGVPKPRPAWVQPKVVVPKLATGTQLVTKCGVPRIDRGVFPWSPAELGILRSMRADGCSATVIADELGRSRNSVIGKMFRLKPKVSDVCQVE
jgi:hypothetical protein